MSVFVHTAASTSAYRLVAGNKFAGGDTRSEAVDVGAQPATWDRYCNWAADTAEPHIGGYPVWAREQSDLTERGECDAPSLEYPKSSDRTHRSASGRHEGSGKKGFGGTVADK
jgi:hypothetical protein